ncbi:hypothetical protein P3L10_011159 [Capsicum annuum]
MDLLRRSFFQETEEHEFPFFQETELDSPHFYKMHDLIHDLAKEVAGREFFSIIKAEDTEIIPDQTLHTSCLFKIDDSSSFPNSFYRKHMKLRTFIYLNGSPNSVISNSTLERMISSFARLRVLQLRQLQIKFQPQSLGRLKHLRYLSISSKSIFNLPNSITNLHKLQILNLVCCFKLKKLPRDIWRLLSVKFEYGNHEDDAGADLIMLEALQPHQNIESLEILNYSGQGFCSKCQKLPLLWKLSSLQSLELRYLDGLEGYDDKFMLPSNTPIDECYFSSLKRLELEKINEKILKQILCPPHHPSPLCNLKDLSLDSLEGLATMPEDVFKNLNSELPTARVDQRRGNAISGPGNLSTFSVVGLDKIMSLPIRHFSGTLKSIDITECPNFATILDWIGDLIALNRLAIDDSPMLKSLPEGMQSLTALQKLIVIGGSSILKQRFKKEVGEDWPKIAHVPTVDIDDDWN